MRIAIAGASGLLGQRLVPLLSEAGHSVVCLVRRAANGPQEIPWDPETGTLDAGRLEGIDGLIHLGGAGIADSRWSNARKAEIRSSRVESTRLLVDTLGRLKQRPQVFVCSSAIGYYGDRQDDVLPESAPAGRGFLADVCAAWEAEALRAAELKIRTICVRTGLVLSAQGGMLAKVLTPFRAGLGGRVGSGRQWMSWIAIDDMLAVLAWLVTAPVSGPVNAVAPNPVTNEEFTRALGRVLKRPTFASLPAIAVRMMFGEMGDELLLAGQRVAPRVLLENGFEFRHTEIEPALQAILAA